MIHETKNLNYNPTQYHENNRTPKVDYVANQMVQTNQHELNAFFYAGFGRRFFSYIIDLLVLWGFSQMILNPIYTLTGINEWKLWINYFSVDHILNALIYFSYFVFMTKYFQQTIGKMILGISVYNVSITPLNWSDVLFREWIGRIISNILLGLPYLFVIFTPKHIGVHDYFADTVVVKNKYLKYIKENEALLRDKSSDNPYNNKVMY
ncbi:RDD family protein [Staphylococcus felis]|nr:RDD family protein [Staphylococcus felis]REI15596.1 RDD family protein [Staphylococcus felis]REI28905.1 RDD family protein [Staphylococcus felis]